MQEKNQKTVASVVIGVAALAGLLLIFINRNINDYSDHVYPEATTQQPDEHFTREQFAKMVLGMTKRDVRERFGEPAYTNGPDEWVYVNPPVYDEDAGTQLGRINITFGFWGSRPVSAYIIKPNTDKCNEDADECAIIAEGP